MLKNTVFYVSFGYMLSPLLWKKIARGLSAGHVQSVVVRLIIERERKIKNFIPKRYWFLHVGLESLWGKKLIFQVICQDSSRFFLVVEEMFQKARIELLSFVNYIVTKRVDKVVISSPSLPFITSTLQQKHI